MKSIVSKSVTLSVLLLLPALSHAEVSITEIMYDYSGSDDSHEWVEIFYNDPVRDWANWKLVEGGVNHGLTYIQGGIYNSSVMDSGEYAVIADNSSQFLIDYPEFVGKLFDSSFSLSNTGESLVLKDGSGNVYASTTYSSADGARGDGNSLQLQSDGIWKAATSSPGIANITLVEVVQEEQSTSTAYYVVDEKTRVLFGDSGEIGSYLGLENYILDYIGGYAHITFTYTHNQCCFASYPPRIIISDLDPNATVTPQIKLTKDIYPLMQFSHNTEHVTDWYLYDIQFDATGYTLSVKRAGQTEVVDESNKRVEIDGLSSTDWVTIRNEYSSSPTEYSISFKSKPVVQVNQNPDPETVPQAPTTTPVIIVPGIMGSTLNLDGAEKWPNVVLMTLSSDDSYLDELILDQNGNLSSSVFTTSLIKTLGNKDFFENLLIQLQNTGHENIIEYSYDWRLNIKSLALKLGEKVEEIKLQTGVEKVDIIAHSMGGLLFKQYLNDYGGGSVNKFIDIGTPHTGAPKAYKILSYGDALDATFFFGLIGLNAEKIKTISQNMPAVYQLLPSRNYFNDSDPNYRYYLFDGVEGAKRMDFEQTQAYLKTQGRNSALVDLADELHQEIDNLNPADYGVDAYNIIGCGTPTLGQIYVLEKKGDKYSYNIKMINGDGTVPIRSAEAMQASSTYYVKNAVHATMPSTSGVKELIAGILSTESGEVDISMYSNLYSSSAGCAVPNGKIVSFHSPIELHVYDDAGNHSGPDANGDIENNIEGVIYEVIDDNKFAFLPDGVEYTVKGIATAEGDFSILIQELVDGETATSTVFSNMPLTQNTKAEFNIGAALPTQINLDHNSDGSFESSQTVGQVKSGLIESLEEDAIEPPRIPSAPPRSSSRSQTKRLEKVINLAVSQDNQFALRPITIAQDSSPVIAKASQVRVVQQTIVSTDTPRVAQTATAFKSLNQSVIIKVRSLWRWFKSKF